MLVLTTFDLDEYVYAALRAGASGFLLKDAPPAELVDGDPRGRRRRGAARADRDPAAGRAVRPAPAGRPSARPAELDGADRRASSRSCALVARGLSNAEIAGALHRQRATVKTHVRRVLAKLGLRDRVQAVVLAYESGLVQPGG